MNSKLAGLLAVVALAAATSSSTASAVHEGTLTQGQAWFEDHWIDLTVDWEEATACHAGPDSIVCFRTEAELDRSLRRALTVTTKAAQANCGSILRLYDGTHYTGTMMALSSRGSVINLSGLGFDNVTSSYKIGACNSDFYSGASLTGSLYPGNTNAGAQASTMLAGWNNAVSSVYIY